MARRPTIVDVAKAAGVSKSTVSLVLQESPLVKEDTRRHVQKTIADVGYVYNRSAANLRSSATGLISLVINDIRNPFFTEFAASLHLSLARQGYAAVLANTNEDPELQADVINALIEHGVSAFIISPAYDDTNTGFDTIARAGLPAMQVLRKADDRVELFPFAAPDYKAGSLAATRHLLDMGARRIAFVGGLEGRPVTQERMSGYLAVLKDNGLEPCILTGETSRDFGRKAAHILKKRHPEVDGVLCFNDLVALGIMAGCAKIGRRVGHELRLVGIDDIEDCRQSHPTLSSIRCNIPEFADSVSAQLLEWLKTGHAPISEQRTPVDLIVRSSSGNLS